jgi:hypothetical protein
MFILEPDPKDIKSGYIIITNNYKKYLDFIWPKDNSLPVVPIISKNEYLKYGLKILSNPKDFINLNHRGKYFFEIQNILDSYNKSYPKLIPNYKIMVKKLKSLDKINIANGIEILIKKNKYFENKLILNKAFEIPLENLPEYYPCSYLDGTKLIFFKINDDVLIKKHHNLIEYMAVLYLQKKITKNIFKVFRKQLPKNIFKLLIIYLYLYSGIFIHTDNKKHIKYFKGLQRCIRKYKTI